MQNVRRSFAVSVVAILAVVVGAASTDAALVSWWRGEGNAADSAGTNNGALVGGVAFGAGTSGQAFVFNGTDGVVNVPDTASLAITGSMTIDAWIKPAAYNPDGALIVFRGDDRNGFDPYFLRLQPDGKIEFTVSDAANTQSSVFSQIVPLNAFTHLTATLDNATGQQQLYVNGALAALAITTVRPFAVLDATQNPGVSIGNHNRYAPLLHNNPFNGTIDEVKIFNSVEVPEPACAAALFLVAARAGMRHPRR